MERLTWRRYERWLEQPIERLEILRILLPLCVLGFMKTRMIHADEWIGRGGFRVPDLAGDYRQPLFVPGLPDGAAWTVAAVMLVSGLAVCVGFRARYAALVFAATLAFVGLSDRLSAFTVTKLSPVLMLGLACGPIGSRFGVDAYLARRRNPEEELPRTAAGPVRFFQILLPVIYSTSGIAKLAGDWLSSPYVLFTLLHDSYQTTLSWMLANALPAAAWTILQIATLVFEAGAPLWFWWKRSRPWALYAGLGMHAFIGLSFGPVKWFAMLMMGLLLGTYLPARPLARVGAFLARVTGA